MSGQTKNRVGGEVDSFCGKCKTEQRHVIVAMIEGTPKRVECLSCHAAHNYRPVSGRAAPRQRATSKKAAPRAAATGVAVPREGEASKPYTPKGKFAADALIKHPTFGVGRVVSVGSRIMSVAFRDQVRKLVFKP